MLLFVWILCRSSLLSFGIARRADRSGSDWIIKQIVVALMVATIVNSVFGLTFTLYSIAPLCWLFMGWISAETLKLRRQTEREVITIRNESERELITI
jgi:hypothetical protein